MGRGYKSLRVITFLSYFFLNNLTQYCDIAVTQINYLTLNKQDSIEQANSQSHKEGLV
jgi:hypothetical protein